MKNNFYKVGGTLAVESKAYIQREADTLLYNSLKDSKYCYVLNARQVGKSSLRVQTSHKLTQEGYKCINIDMSAFGSKNITLEEWYKSIIYLIIKQLKIVVKEIWELWNELKSTTMVNRFAQIIDKILDEYEDNIIIFIDEIDYLLPISNFSTDDFFAVIRTFYNLRSEESKYNRLTFAIFGVARAEDLMTDSSRTPFNIATNIKLSQLEYKDATSLKEGLGNQRIDTQEILKKVFEYTSGTPYLTQKIL